MRSYSNILNLLFLFLIALASPMVGQNEGTEAEIDSRALANYLEGDLMLMAGNYRKAAALFSLALKYDSTSATIYQSLGQALLMNGQFAKAKFAAEKALQLEPDWIEPYDLLVRVATGTEDLKGAIKYLDQWIKLDGVKFEEYVVENEEQFRECDADILEKAKDKWDRLVFAKTAEPWPMVLEAN